MSSSAVLAQDYEIEEAVNIAGVTGSAEAVKSVEIPKDGEALRSVEIPKGGEAIKSVEAVKSIATVKSVEDVQSVETAQADRCGSYRPKIITSSHAKCTSIGAENAVKKMEVSNLNLYYKDFHALHNINLEFPKNQITALIGPSGCGKSTLLKSLNRMNDLVPGCKITGEISLDSINAYNDIHVNELRRRVGMVFQQPNPFPMSVYDNVAFGPRTHGVKKRADLDEIVEQSLRDAAIWDELKDRLKKNALGLSGGQQQRLCIARALASRPEVLLLDESTSALDPISTAKIEELMTELKKRYTIIMVTHNMLQALRISDKTAFFLLGDMVESGPTQAIFTSPSDSRTADYVAGRFG